MRRCEVRKPIYATAGLFLLAACTHAPARLSNPAQYVRIGVLPAYGSEIVKRTPPGLLEGAIIEHLDLDLGLNRMIVGRVVKSMGQSYKLIDLSPLAATYLGAPKVYSGDERKIFNDSRPLFTDVLKSIVGTQHLDAYLVVDGGPVRLTERQVAPAFQLLSAQGHDLSMRMNIYVVDDRTFKVAASYEAHLARDGIPDSWFFAPKQHVVEIRAAVVDLLNRNFAPALQQLGFIFTAPATADFLRNSTHDPYCPTDIGSMIAPQRLCPT